jgi:gamma-glutamylcyclotransferase (GGCT)/AIG2-like uncharacterized protein YtfP
MASDERRFHLFVYGTLLPDEPDHHLIADAKELGPAKTKPIYHLVELQTSAALLEGGRTEIVGALYELDVHALAACDIKREHPVLYKRQKVLLSDDSEAWSYFLSVDQTRGRRRVRHGDWKNRFRSQSERQPGPFVRWARSRRKR